ncbi:craniofacial development protein 2-like [Macrobrachium rosenbergii]|uniref:craniofacial development protein 2-like n=1 Tax=Macrobrachium rosenbergii TaxID=79674 RepID=UPI0034D3DC73
MVVVLRVGTLNVGTITGKGREIADLMKIRKISILHVQETRWRGNKVRCGYKLLYSGAKKEGRNGVGIIQSKSLKDNIIGVRRTNDRAMVVKLFLDGKTVNIVSAYPPQAECDKVEKVAFWQEMDRHLSEIQAEERSIIAGDMNVHVGRTREGIERVHGGWGVGERNDDGERVLDCAVSFGLAIVKTWFEKKENHYITYKSGARENQTDFLMGRRSHLREVRNCNILNEGCDSTAQGGSGGNGLGDKEHSKS